MLPVTGIRQLRIHSMERDGFTVYVKASPPEWAKSFEKDIWIELPCSLTGNVDHYAHNGSISTPKLIRVVEIRIAGGILAWIYPSAIWLNGMCCDGGYLERLLLNEDNHGDV